MQGLKHAALAFGGFSSLPDTWQATTEYYNGTNWTEA